MTQRTLSIREQIKDILPGSSFRIIKEGHLEQIDSCETMWNWGFFELGNPDYPIFNISGVMVKQRDLYKRRRCALIEYTSIDGSQKIDIIGFPRHILDIAFFS